MKPRIQFLIVSLVTLLSSCDYVKEDEVFIKKTIDTNSTIDPNSNTSQRVAFIEYFTGHQCGNCPTKGADQIKEISKVYGDKMVYISNHTGFFARFTASNSKYYYNFKSTAGDAIESTYKIAQQGTPQGMVNRKLNQTSRAFSPSNWAQEVDKISKEIVPFKITVLNSSTTTDKIEISYTIAASENLLGISTLVYLVEDSITNWQKDYTLINQDVENYVHHNVLRDEIGSQTDFNIDALAAKSFSFSGVNQAIYNQKQLYAYVLVIKNEEVLQVSRVKL